MSLYKVFKRQSHQMAKHTQTIRRQIADGLLECFWPFCEIGAKRVKVFNLVFPDRLNGYFLLIIKNIDTSSHWKSNCPFFVINTSKIHNFVQMFWWNVFGDFSVFAFLSFRVLWVICNVKCWKFGKWNQLRLSLVHLQVHRSANLPICLCS